MRYINLTIQYNSSLFPPDLSVVGSDVKDYYNYKSLDSLTQKVALVDPPLPSNGVISAFVLHSTRLVEATLQMWRPRSVPNSFTLVFQKAFTATAAQQYKRTIVSTNTPRVCMKASYL